jgi:hypothetical protein
MFGGAIDLAIKNACLQQKHFHKHFKKFNDSGYFQNFLKFCTKGILVPP